MKKSIEIINSKVRLAIELMETMHLPLPVPHIETEQYSRGGETIHRGYYCPSLVKDIIVGGANRGKLLKHCRVPPTYTYGFDANGDLVEVKNNDTRTHEIITRDGDLEIGITSEWFAPDKIGSISLAEYRSGIIHPFVRCICDIYAETINEVQGEVYEYQHGVLKKVCDYMSGWRLHPVTKENFADWGKGPAPYLIEFEHDANGYLKSYRYIEPSANAGQVYQVLLKRRA